ncbi:MAG: hypothetical protein R3240_04410, partial [Gammaproteobacteria bacterium]|nr:hypothetical protein [Gammaproteobacteria bacterium]
MSFNMKAILYFILMVILETTWCLAPLQANEIHEVGTSGNNGLKQRVERLEEALANLSSSQPINVDVDCSAGESVQDILNKYARVLAELDITVKGVCTESVTIYRDYTNIRGAQPGDGFVAPSPGRTVVSIYKARHVQLEHLSISQGIGGLSASDGANFSAIDLHIDGAHQGVVINVGASGEIEDSYIDNCGIGATANWNGSLRIISSEINSSQVFGVTTANNASIQLFDNSVVRNTAFHGVYADEGGSIDINNSTVES